MTDEPVTVRFVADAGTRKMLTREGDYAEGYAAGFGAAKKAALMAADAEVQSWTAWQRYALGHRLHNEAVQHEVRIDVARTIAKTIAALKPEDRE